MVDFFSSGRTRACLSCAEKTPLRSDSGQCPLFPSTSHVIQRLTQSLSSFRSTCPNHLNLLFLIIKLTKKSRLRWFGHVERKDDNDWVKRGLRRAKIFWLHLTTASAQCLRLSKRFFHCKGKGRIIDMHVGGMELNLVLGSQLVAIYPVVITFCQACGYLSSRKVSLPFGWYQIILLV